MAQPVIDRRPKALAEPVIVVSSGETNGLRHVLVQLGRGNEQLPGRLVVESFHRINERQVFVGGGHHDRP